jgi:protein TonB
MIKHPFIVALALFAVSLAAHGAILSITDRTESAAISGGADASVAQLGNSFQDMVVGVMTAEPMTKMVEDVTPSIQNPTQSTEVTERDVAAAVTQPVQPDVQTPTTAMDTKPTKTTPAVSAPVTPIETVTVAPEIAPSTIHTALSEPPEENVRVSRRPAIRPKALEQAVAAATPKSIKPPKPKPRGKAETRTRAGVLEGKPAAVATVAAPRKAAGSSKAANAAISNYPGQVMRRLARQRRPRAASKGTAIV